ncbi:MAG: hypothetical protein MUC41_01955 [Syntrophobacteraceae bacterium]|jgi:hypothetical protein|nr:hypothetical protein [Syntrophobacteraceae bacterium]
MAENSYNCDVRQGFNFEKDAQAWVGHIVGLKIGTQQLSADMAVTDPTSANMGTTVKVVGVVSNIFWNGGYADPIQFNCRVSTTNKNSIATLVHQSLSNTEVDLKFNIYEYDPQQKAYFKCFHTNDADIKGLIMKSGGDLQVSVDMDENMDVVSPKNFSFTLGVMPQPSAQSVQVAVSTSAKFAKAWGVAVG